MKILRFMFFELRLPHTLRKERQDTMDTQTYRYNEGKKKTLLRTQETANRILL